MANADTHQTRSNKLKVFAATEPYESQVNPPCVLHPSCLEALRLSVGDAVLIKAGGRARRQNGSWPKCIVRESSLVAEDGMLLSAATRTDLNLEVGAVGTVRFLHSAQTVLVPCPAKDVGRVIGRGGTVLKQVQRDTGARNIRIKKDGNGISFFEIKGTTEQVKDAEIAINTILSAPRTATTPVCESGASSNSLVAGAVPDAGNGRNAEATNIDNLTALPGGSSAAGNRQPAASESQWHCLKRFEQIPKTDDPTKWAHYESEAGRSLQQAASYLERIAFLAGGHIEHKTDDSGVISLWFVRRHGRLETDVTDQLEQMRRIVHARGRIDALGHGPGRRLQRNEHLAATSAMTPRELEQSQKRADIQRKAQRGKRR